MNGIGVMLGFLSGNERTVNTIKSALGKTIQSVCLDDNRLKFKFTDGTGIYLFDNGQSCCEHRYMVTDDILSDYDGAELIDFAIKDSPNQVDEWGEVHEIQFLEVVTSNGSFQMSNHNEHNGYYCGFLVVAEEL